MKETWGKAQIPRLEGKTAVVTGANSGIGYHTALELARAGAEVIVACRDAARGEAAVERMGEQAPGARLTLEPLDLADLASVRAFAAKWSSGGKALDILVNNAGIMAIPTREATAQGFERQLGTNHLGHFALTGLLLPSLLASPAPRVVTVSSTVARMARLDLDDLQSERGYAPMRAYGRSKLANLFFMLELDRRARHAGLVSAGAHPGASVSNLQRYAFGRIIKLIGQPAADGALPSLYAATAPGVTGGTYFGPGGWFEIAGPPAPAHLPKHAQDPATAGALWEASERLTGVTYAFPEYPVPAAAATIDAR